MNLKIRFLFICFNPLLSPKSVQNTAQMPAPPPHSKKIPIKKIHNSLLKKYKVKANFFQKELKKMRIRIGLFFVEKDLIKVVCDGVIEKYINFNVDKVTKQGSEVPIKSHFK